jgi:hypothetical protein
LCVYQSCQDFYDFFPEFTGQLARTHEQISHRPISLDCPWWVILYLWWVILYLKEAMDFGPENTIGGDGDRQMIAKKNGR